MSITSFQTGTITLTDLTQSATLSTTVTQGNSILIVTARGGSNTVAHYNVRVTLSSDGTTVTATRPTSGSSQVTVEYQVIESSSFTVQHFETTISASGTHNQTITSVDTSYSFPVSLGLSATGGSRSSDDFVSVRITSATNAQLEVGSSSSITVAYQIVEMSSSEIASVQEVTTTIAAVTNDVTITSVDTAKSLIFASSWTTTAGGNVVNRQMPILLFTSATNLRFQTANNAATGMTVYAYVVEFVNLPVTHTLTSSLASTTTTEVLGATPTNGGAVINGLMGKFATANDNDDDSLEAMFTASLSGTTWTFERGASTTDADISYSVFDWADIFSGSGITAALATTLGTLTLNADANADIGSTADITLGALTLDAVTGIEVDSTLDTTLGALTLSADGTVVTGISASLDTTLDSLILDADAATTVDGTLSITLADLELTAVGVYSGQTIILGALKRVRLPTNPLLKIKFSSNVLLRVKL